MINQMVQKSERYGKTVITGLNPIRTNSQKIIVISFKAKMGKHRPFGLATFDPGKTQFIMRVGLMFRFPQGFNYPEIKIMEKGKAFFRNINNIGGIPDTFIKDKTKTVHPTVMLKQHFDVNAAKIEPVTGRDHMRFK